MQFHQTIFFLLSFFTVINALALPTSFDSFAQASTSLFKRKGGGGGGGGGGRGGGSSSSSSSSSSSGSSGSSGSSAGRSGSSSSGTTGGTTGGAASRGAPTYGPGGAFAGGATSPVRSGVSRGGVAPYLLGGAALGALAVLPGIWLYGAYAYNFNHPYTYHNDSANRNDTRPITCLCGQYQQCGCDGDNNSTDWVSGVANNASLAKVANVNGTERLVINGTLPNDTTAASSTSGGSTTGAAGKMVEMSGYWPVVAGVVYTVLFI